MAPKNKSHILSSDKLKTYSALACSLTAISNTLDAQIVYTDIADYTGSTNGAVYNIDLNADATNDFTISVYKAGTSNYVYAEALTGNALGGSPNVSALNAGAVINNAIAWQTGSDTMASWSSTGPAGGNWANVTNKYLPLRIKISGQDHYGWARLDVSIGASIASFTIKDFAYNTVAGQQITAGQIIGGINDVPENKNVSIHSYNRTIYVEIKDNGQPRGSISVYNTLGEEIIKTEITDNFLTIDMAGFNNGIYLVKFNQPESVFTKKIYVH